MRMGRFLSWLQNVYVGDASGSGDGEGEGVAETEEAEISTVT